MKRIVFLLCHLVVVVSMQAQKLTVVEMKLDEEDHSAIEYPRMDKIGNQCALVKVMLPEEGAQFEGNVLGDVAYRSGEYWVYMSAGTKELRVNQLSGVWQGLL